MSNFDESASGAAQAPVVSPSPLKTRKVLPVHPLLFAAFPIFAFLAQNFTKVPLQQIFSPLIAAIEGTIAAWLCFLLLTRRDWRAVTAISVVVLLYVSNDAFTHALPEAHRGIVLPLSLLGTMALFAVLAGTQRPLYDAQSVRKAGVATSVAVLLFFSVGHIVELLPKGLHALVLPACLLALAALLWVIAKARSLFTIRRPP